MNNLSWFLYAVDLLGNLQGFFGWAAVLLGIFIPFILCVMINETWDDDKKPKLWRYLRTSVVSGVIFCLLAIVIPSQKTMYLILGSEVGQKVIQSDTGKKVFDVINKKLDEYLKEEPQ